MTIRYARIDPVTDEVIETVTRAQPYRKLIRRDKATARRTPFFLPVETVQQSFNSATQVIGDEEFTVLTNKVQAARPVRDKTPAELNAWRAEEADGLLSDPRFVAFAKVCAQQFGMTPKQLRDAVKDQML